MGAHSRPPVRPPSSRPLLPPRPLVRAVVLAIGVLLLCGGASAAEVLRKPTPAPTPAPTLTSRPEPFPDETGGTRSPLPTRSPIDIPPGPFPVPGPVVPPAPAPPAPPDAPSVPSDDTADSSEERNPAPSTDPSPAAAPSASPSPSVSPSPEPSAAASTASTSEGPPPGPEPPAGLDATGEPDIAFGYAPPDPVSDGRPLGTAAAWLLPILALVALALRLSVGWPRFPPRYRGRRRVGGDGDPFDPGEARRLRSRGRSQS